MTAAPTNPLTDPSQSVAEGLEGIVVTATALSDVRGSEGRLILRGTPIEDLAGQGTSFDTAVDHLCADMLAAEQTAQSALRRRSSARRTRSPRSGRGRPASVRL